MDRAGDTRVQTGIADTDDFAVTRQTEACRICGLRRLHNRAGHVIAGAANRSLTNSTDAVQCRQSSQLAGFFLFGALHPDGQQGACAQNNGRYCSKASTASTSAPTSAIFFAADRASRLPKNAMENTSV